MTGKYSRVLVFTCLFVGIGFVLSGCGDDTVLPTRPIAYRIKVINMSPYYYDFMIHKWSEPDGDYILFEEHQIGCKVGDSVPGFEIEVDGASMVRIRRQGTDQWLTFGNGKTAFEVNGPLTITINEDGTSQ